MFCKHNWQVLSEVTTKSMFEHSMEVASSFFKSRVEIPHQMCDATRKIIQIVSCEKCGKIKRYVTEI
jgi:hypothetical protein